MRNLFFITLLITSVACTRTEQIKGYVCDCRDSFEFRSNSFHNPEKTVKQLVIRHCADTVITINSNWPNRVQRLDDNYPDCYKLFTADFETLTD